MSGVLCFVVTMLLALSSLAETPAARIGVEMPAAGDDGGAGIAVLTAIRLALPDRVVARDSAHGGFANPHRDEGSDNDVDVRSAPAIVASFASDARIVAAVGGLRRNVGDAAAGAAEAHGLPIIVLSRWSRSPHGANAFCLCVSPPRLVGYARATARARFGPRLLLVLVGEAAALPSRWPGRFTGAATARIGRAPADVETARLQALDADAVLVLADERPPTLWRAAVFRRTFDAAYVRRLGHRDFEAVPRNTPRGAVVVIRDALPDGPTRRAFAREFRAAAGFVPGTEATRGFAAAQVLRAAGTARSAVRSALRTRHFETVAGNVGFDTDGYRDGALLTATVVGSSRRAGGKPRHPA